MKTLLTSGKIWELFQEHALINEEYLSPGINEFIQRATFLKEIKMIEHDGKFMTVEERIDDEFFKYNSNGNFAKTDNEFLKVFNAFSHFSIFNSNKDLLVCDLQGSLKQLTDPQIHSASNPDSYSLGNRGKDGIDEFINEHTCNDVCKAMGYQDLYFEEINL